MTKKILIILSFVLIAAFITSCSGDKGVKTMNQVGITAFPKGNVGPKDYFVNTVYVQMLHTDEKKEFDTQVYNVTFEPSARTYWHSHPGGQILLITSGTGYYQEEGKPAQVLKPGEIVAIPPNVNHWHGAAPKSQFVHLGMSTNVNLGPAKWNGPVTDEQYKEATANNEAKEAVKKTELPVFPKGNVGPKNYFVNTVYVQMLHTDEKKEFDTQVYNVTFEPSARTYWHSHPGGQILLITGGIGYYQEEGKAAQVLKPGEIVAIPPNVNHWHGAAPKSQFIHLGMSTNVNLGPAKWNGPVTDEQYKEATSR